MIIHSKNHDYYDTASAWRSDFHWTRVDDNPQICDSISVTWTNMLNIREFDSVFLVGFCGKIYKGIIRKEDPFGIESFEYTDSSAINISEWQKYLLEYPVFIIQQRKYRGSSWFHNSPILKDWSFYKVKDAFTAHQEIEQYLTNDLASQQDGLQIAESEVQILQRHGMFSGSFKHRKKYGKNK